MASKDNARVKELRDALMFAIDVCEFEGQWPIEIFEHQTVETDSNTFEIRDKDGKSYEVSIQIPKR